MKVYILQEVYPYEGADTIGVYSSREIAERNKKIAEKAKLTPYTEIEIEEMEMNTLPIKDME